MKFVIIVALLIALPYLALAQYNGANAFNLALTYGNPVVAYGTATREIAVSFLYEVYQNGGATIIYNPLQPTPNTLATLLVNTNTKLTNVFGQTLQKGDILYHPVKNIAAIYGKNSKGIDYVVVAPQIKFTGVTSQGVTQYIGLATSQTLTSFNSNIGYTAAYRPI